MKSQFALDDEQLTVRAVAWFMRLISTKYVCTIEAFGDCMLCHLRLGGGLKTSSDAPRRHHAGVMRRGLSSLPSSSIPRLAVWGMLVLTRSKSTKTCIMKTACGHDVDSNRCNFTDAVISCVTHVMLDAIYVNCMSRWCYLLLTNVGPLMMSTLL